MTGEGVVVSVSGNSATVLIRKKGACSHDCDNCSACSNPAYKTEVRNDVGAVVGDKVLIEGDTAKILGISFVVYILPVILLFVAAIICDMFTLGTVAAILVFGVIVALWIAVIRLADKKLYTQNAAVQILSEDAVSKER